MPENNQVQAQEEIKVVRPTQAWGVFAVEAFLFSLTLILGIVTAFRAKKFFQIQEIPLSDISFWQFLFYFFLATLFLFLLTFLRKFKRGKGTLFKGVFILAVFWGGALLLSLWILDIFALFLMTVLIFRWLKRPTVLVHNLCVILGIAGVGSVLGLRFEPLMVVILLIVLSIYDFIAVYKTKHMIKMAKEMIETGAILALIVPQKISDFKADLKKVKPGGKFLILGGGDMVFPLLLCASLISQGILYSLIVAFFSLIGLFASFCIFTRQKIRQPIPALPPIALFSIIGFLITRLI